MITPAELTGFAAIPELEAGRANDTRYAGAAEVAAALPAVLTASWAGGTFSVPVSDWTDTDGYDRTQAGRYTFTAVCAAPANFANSGNHSAAVEVVVDVETVISIREIAGVTAPAYTEVPVTEITPTEEYTGTVTWTPGVAGTFADSTRYTATVTLTQRPGYTFVGVAEDFFTVAGAAVTNSADSGTVTAVFPWTDSVYIPPEKPPANPSTELPGGSAVTTPADKPPVREPDGSVTLPGGGTVVTPGGEKVTVPPDSSIDQNGTVTVGNGGGKVEKNSVTVTVPGGTNVTPDGTVSFPQGSGGGSVTHGDSGHTFKIPEGAVLSFDETAPFGYRVDMVNPFTDVKEGDWFYDDVLFAYGHGLFQGTSATEFSPGAPMTRGMFVTVLHRMADPAKGADTTRFSDVPLGQWYSDAIAWSAHNGIVKGVTETQFAPDAPITRQDLAVILERYMTWANMNIPVTEEYRVFADEDEISGYAKNAVQRMNKLGVITGRGERNGQTVIDPKVAATRAEVAAILHRFIEAVSA
jgi:hypothetical protein